MNSPHLSHQSKLQNSPIGRVQAVDWARGVAFIAMAIYHFTWDLQFFGWLQPGFIQQPQWVYFARSIASSFLFLTGFSLVLGHTAIFNASKFYSRLAKISAAAVLITLATYFATPNGFIYFGILHSIAVASVLALIFMPLPWFVLLPLAALWFWIPSQIQIAALDNWFGYWTGLATNHPLSNDYVPIFPWFSAVLAGTGVSKLMLRAGVMQRLARASSNGKTSKLLGFISRNSLLFYLIHQPILVSLVWLSVQVLGPPDRTPAFLASCQISCVVGSGKSYCQKFCQCTASEFKTAQIWQSFHQGKINVSSDPKTQEILKICSAK